MIFDLRNISLSSTSVAPGAAELSGPTVGDAPCFRPASESLDPACGRRLEPRSSHGPQSSHSPQPSHNPWRRRVCIGLILAGAVWGSHGAPLTAQQPVAEEPTTVAQPAAEAATDESSTTAPTEVAVETPPPPPPPAAPSLPVPPHPLALPRYESSGLDGFFHIQLDSGQAYLNERLDNPPLRSRRLDQNISREIGLATGMSIGDLLLGPIRNGDGSLKAALLVETATGYVAFLDDIGRDSKLGAITVAIDRPFQSLAADDRGASLLMRRDSSGRTEGAYLYHATSGRAVYLDGLRKLDPAGAVTATVPWPTLGQRAATVALQSPREETLGYWLGDPSTGESYRVSLNRGAPTRISTRKLTVNLFDAIAGRGPHATYDPLVAVGLEDRNGETRHIFLLSVGSGEMAVWFDVAGNGGSPSIVKLTRNLYDVLGSEPAPVPRTIEAIPQVGGDGVDGVYLLDSVTRRVVLVGDLTQPSGATLASYGDFGG